MQSDRRHALQFEWDPDKENANVRKHRVSFGLALTVFRDPGLVTIFDVDHSEAEERWVSVGRAANGVLLVVVYTWTELTDETFKVRIISARTATTPERRGYGE